MCKQPLLTMYLIIKISNQIHRNFLNGCRPHCSDGGVCGGLPVRATGLVQYQAGALAVVHDTRTQRVNLTSWFSNRVCSSSAITQSKLAFPARTERYRAFRPPWSSRTWGGGL